MSDHERTPVFTDLRRTFEWTCPECGNDHYDVGEVDGQILTCDGCSKAVLVRWPGVSAEGTAAVSVGSGEPCQHVAEELEWEYGVEMPLHTGTVVVASRDEATARAEAWLYPLHRRRKAGPWVPVKQEGAEHE